MITGTNTSATAEERARVQMRTGGGGRVKLVVGCLHSASLAPFQRNIERKRSGINRHGELLRRVSHLHKAPINGNGPKISSCRERRLRSSFPNHRIHRQAASRTAFVRSLEPTKRRQLERVLVVLRRGVRSEKFKKTKQKKRKSRAQQTLCSGLMRVGLATATVKRRQMRIMDPMLRKIDFRIFAHISLSLSLSLYSRRVQTMVYNYLRRL